MTYMEPGGFYQSASGDVWVYTNAQMAILIVPSSGEKTDIGVRSTAHAFEKQNGAAHRVYPTWSETPPARVFQVGESVRIRSSEFYGNTNNRWVVTGEMDSEGEYPVANHGHVMWKRFDEIIPWEDEV